MKRLLLAALLVAGCGAPTGAEPTTFATITPASTVTPQPTTTPDATADVGTLVARIVASIDELAGHVASADKDAIVEWFNTEGDWLANDPTAPGILVSYGLTAYTAAMLAGLAAISDGTDLIAPATTMVNLRDQIVALAPDSAPARPTPEPTPEGPKLFQPGDSVLVTRDGEDWAEIVVTGVKQVKRYDGEYLDDTPAKGNVYIQLKITYTAIANDVNYNPFDWQVFAGGVAMDSYAFVSNGPTPQLGSGDLPTGRKATGWLVYEVPTKGQVLFSYGGAYGEAPVFEVELRKK